MRIAEEMLVTEEKRDKELQSIPFYKEKLGLNGLQLLGHRGHRTKRQHRMKGRSREWHRTTLEEGTHFCQV